ncbi:hypothetical protein G647_03531 [Cladophialophora carrionii CBS 160.54]|uniref:Uncharacterized protein n=1 Tax=Cladophialophora carrionii CBS 160.54 TaxID=1279043 RepID=V9DDW9_9EURO|nr:uncharacterized protein G647_03531 [Cladophialophora carrionii CBS 160.54]ETI24162.1 hypothetical protein G647_03531 [Cladophialophora carrionii CBS 160.54]
MSGLNPGFTTKNTADAGASSATKTTDQTEGIFEDASSDMKSKQQGSVLGSNLQGGLLDQIGGSSTGHPALGYDAKHGSSVTGTAEAKGKDLYEDARKGAHSAENAASNSLEQLKGTAAEYAESAKDTAGNMSAGAQNAAHDATSGSGSHGGLLDTVREKVSGVFGGGHSTVQSRQASNFDAGASSATKSTDLTEGIHEDASKGIESVKGATTRGE